MLRLVVAPTVLGDGRRLFAEQALPIGFRAVDHRLTPAGVAVVEYQATGEALLAEFTGVGGFI